jgi:radical SAM protein with 4Fe4S-binding SPASM domain
VAVVDVLALVPVQVALAHVQVAGDKILMNLWERLRKDTRFSHSPNDMESPAPGLYHFQRDTGQEKSRIHLRLNPDGTGLLIVNASRAFHLNATAAHLAYLTLSEIPITRRIRDLTKRFRLSRQQALKDCLDIETQLLELIRSDSACPICDLSLDTTPSLMVQPLAPVRMDLAITYRCNNRCNHCYNPAQRNTPELSTRQWKQILDMLWQIGIPHIVFTGGEPTLRNDLPELIKHAESNGQITGINTNARRLGDPSFLQLLVDAGLDHIQITVESHNPGIHDAMVTSNGAWQDTVTGLKNALETRLYIMTNTTLLDLNSPYIAQTLDFLASMGVHTVGLNALIYSGKGETSKSGLPESQLSSLLEIARHKTSFYHQKLVWYTPTQYCHFDPLQLELGVKGCSAALYNMCIEPDGNVLPCQSYYSPLGNILTKSWDDIWNHELAIRLRNRQGLPVECNQCSLVIECGGGCPLSRQAHPDRVTDLKTVPHKELEVQ